MRIICVDGDAGALARAVEACRSMAGVREIRGFSRASEALEWTGEHPADIAVLEIMLPETDGLTLAEKLRQTSPDIAVIFLTASDRFALESFRVHPTAYLLKPLEEEALGREIAYARAVLRRTERPRVEVHTFGDFEVLANGETLRFRRARSKELLAFLVDREGNGVTRAQIHASLWEEGEYDHARQKYLDVIIRSLRQTLEQYGVADILEMKGGFLRVRPERIDCDLYRFLRGEPAAVRAYRGKYMSSYAWAALSEGRTNFYNG